MENAELEVAIEELESRLERLRALYEQYFMGIERIEPAIPRKDIDRRIYVLRREKIRNTAKRFKLQTIISRYNTFQQYWQRICREIEQGTYKRHVIKAERIAPGKMLTVAARKRLGRAAIDAMEDGVQQESAAPSAPPESLRPSAPPARPAPPSVPPAAALPGGPRLAPPPKPPPKPGVRPAKPGASAPPPAAQPAAASAAVPPAPQRAPALAPPVAATSAARERFESLDLDLDFLGDWDPASTAGKSGAKRAPEVPVRPFGKPLSRPMSTPPAPPIAPIAPTATGELKAPALTAPKLGSAPLRFAPASASSALPKPAPPKPPVPAALPLASAPARPAPPPLRAVVPAAAREPAPPPPDAKPLAAPIPGASPPRPVPPKPAVAVAAAAAPPKPAAPAAPAATAAVPDERVRELHARLVEAKRQTQDPSAVSMEGLAKSMKATEAKLREQHKNRKIDFDVVIKDGKAVLKPIVR